jgi:hypothetical protein
MDSPFGPAHAVEGPPHWNQRLPDIGSTKIAARTYLARGEQIANNKGDSGPQGSRLPGGFAGVLDK